MKTTFALIVSIGVLSGFVNSVFAQAPSESYTVTGAPGNYTLDFTFNNNMNPATYPGMDLYGIGIYLPSSSISANPGDFVDFGTFNPSIFGGPNINYNDVWIDPTQSDLEPGNSFSGFEVTYTGATAPTSVDFFTALMSPDFVDAYTGGDNFNTENNPGFAGTITSASAPDAASTIELLGAAMMGLGVCRRFLRR
jgi:hypothetical protein